MGQTTPHAEHGMRKIFLVVLEADKTSITTASFNQVFAQQLCHSIAKLTGIPHAVVTEKAASLPLELIKSLCNKSPRFEKELNNLEG